MCVRATDNYWRSSTEVETVSDISPKSCTLARGWKVAIEDRGHRHFLYSSRWREGSQTSRGIRRINPQLSFPIMSWANIFPIVTSPTPPQSTIKYYTGMGMTRSHWQKVLLNNYGFVFPRHLFIYMFIVCECIEDQDHNYPYFVVGD